ncbi:hypothetical protein K402DRAFT_249337 [Aulographum hederae CBS 113979]|uniref:Uncharacterized protein n=1 Tax=Aulographum hederae CBS 113979 TaxID=1176131 RepID=A0A6G1HB49_9PEZI|nr:hypothetical protein K402DRAFT_249337 [Aulographum hederae CBS 113979]
MLFEDSTPHPPILVCSRAASQATLWVSVSRSLCTVHLLFLVFVVRGAVIDFILRRIPSHILEQIFDHISMAFYPLFPNLLHVSPKRLHSTSLPTQNLPSPLRIPPLKRPRQDRSPPHPRLTSGPGKIRRISSKIRNNDTIREVSIKSGDMVQNSDAHWSRHVCQVVGEETNVAGMSKLSFRWILRDVGWRWRWSSLCICCCGGWSCCWCLNGYIQVSCCWVWIWIWSRIAVGFTG